jgi:signal peptidase I
LWRVNRVALKRAVFVVETAFLTVLLTAGVQAYVAQPFRVEHRSMQDTLSEGQMVLVDKLTPRLGGLSRGDIVVFHPTIVPGTDDIPYIKRVIGLPGDHVEIAGGQVRINGRPLNEFGYVYRGEPTLPTSGTSRWDVPAETLFVLGDHRQDSTDSRSAALGLVPMRQVIGRAILRYWPPTEAAILEAPAYPDVQSVRQRAAGQLPGPVTQASTSRR